MSGTDFQGIRVVVTGGSSGIGLAAALRLQGAGASVAVLDLNPPLADGLAFVEANIADDAGVRRAVEAAAQQLGGIDVLVNNAGVGAQGTIEDNDDEEWHRVFDINVLGAVRVTRAALPYLRESSSASVINMCSAAAIVGLSRRALYGAVKGALTSLTLQQAADHLREGIRFNAVHPGTADTPWVQRLLDQADDPVRERAQLEARQPHGRLVAPAEIAEAVAYLASPLAGSTTGTAVTVDGGLTSLRLPAVP